MANTASAIKRVRQESKRRARNRAVKSRMRTFVKQANEAIEQGDRALAADAVRNAISEIDRAASKGVIHSNNASRSKSRLMLRFNVLSE
ncbi:MAG: 30S ribosomal protein S20 [Anaerolineae bacterium]